MTSTANRISTVTIVGGGSAGWLTACTLAKNLGSNQSGAIQVQLIESPDIPTIGVGEGTWPTMRRTLENIGLDEGDFIRECSATFKQGSQFFNWKSPPQGTTDNSYFNLFSSVYNPGDFNLAPYWSLGHAGEGVSYAQAVSSQGFACEQGFAPKKITSKNYQAIQSYAYHLDAGKFSALLKKHAVDSLGVNFISANVIDVELDEDGYVSAVNTKESGRVAGDLFIDCTGFSSLILGKTLGVKFKSASDVLLTDKAIAMQVPYVDEAEDIACVTKSTAQEAGWIWDIGLQHRRGVGHVYSSAHMSDDEAESTLRAYIGEGADEISSRVLDMQIGYREKFWHKNCIGIGLSAAFVEPLEASAIFLVEAAGNMLADLFPRNRSAMVYAEKKFNDSFRSRWDKTIDFIKLHYYLSQRDTPFWRDNKEASTVPDSLREKLEAWTHHPVSKYDFSDINEPFPHESYQYVLHGMEFHQDFAGSIETYTKVTQARQCFTNVESVTKHICKDLPKHRELIEKVCQYGFQTI